MNKFVETLRGKTGAFMLLGAAAILLATGSVGGARAALVTNPEEYTAQVSYYEIGVGVAENEGGLLENKLSGDDELILGKEYAEVLTVENTGRIDEYVRVTVSRSWQDAEGKDTTLDPKFIDLKWGDAWVVDEAHSTDETVILYYTGILAPGAATPAFVTAVTIDEEIGKIVEQTVSGNVQTTVYAYDGYTFNVDVKADAVQTHNAEQAITSAWGATAASILVG